MNKRKLGYLFLGISLILLIAGGFSSFLSNLSADHQTVLRRMDDVSGIFEGFSAKTTIFEDYRDDLYIDVLGNVYYETMYQTDISVKEKLVEYEEIVGDLEKDAKRLDQLCGTVYYPEADINSMCVNYKSIYEQVVNYFVTDIKIYNDNVDKFNDYQKKNQTELFVKKYKTKYQYIDYNGDHEFDGKEE